MISASTLERIRAALNHAVREDLTVVNPAQASGGGGVNGRAAGRLPALRAGGHLERRELTIAHQLVHTEKGRALCELKSAASRRTLARCGGTTCAMELRRWCWRRARS
ncbi:hypothetical protein ACU635_47150 [[Actinomadura] parvosata]|uniref:hypothetical protein n=1 Tax=[Actinomadura] parvosata TaxID=1955412 RepID=UPI00406C376D